jgi:hypothetical protein
MIDGATIIDDLCSRIADRLARSGDLRAVDSYSRYSAKVQIELQLQDLDRVEVSSDLNVGTLNPHLASQHITLDTSVVADEAPSMERPIEEAEAVAAISTQEKRIYVSRVRGAK